MLSVRFIRRYLPLVVLMITSVVAWRSAGRADIDEARLEPVVYEQALATPVLSARRVPRSLQIPIADDALRPTIDAVIAGSPPDTCVVVTNDGRIIGEQNAENPLIPASNEKIVTTALALDLFGPEHTFTTELRTSAAITDGVLAGDLYLVGGGDPFLSTDDWWAQFDTQDARFHTRLESLADQLVATGITSIEGSLLGDESLFDSARTGPWATRLIDSRQSGPLSALAVNEGFQSWPAVFEGSFFPRVPTDDPPSHAAAVFARLLGERGIAVSSTGAGLAPPEAATLTQISSPPLSELVTHVNTYSNNFGAEILLKHIGLARSGVGSTEAGAAAMTAMLDERGLATTGTVLTDGSGLGENTRVTCRLLSSLLMAAGTDSVLADSLSIGGVRGSLIGRHVGTAATGNVYAKTGTLNNVTALSGIVHSPVEPGTSLVFAYIANGELAGQDEVLRGLQEPFVEGLATYPAGPSLASLLPLPPTAVPAPVAAPDEGADG